ncbi:hypothetical protein M2451_002924 [Dysgonomonas sp. PFB1-18]|uniref:hypothetical protein n=1 Tax=unclassified Dysgonomonas TaxID=2630389 RepID=UPI0013D1FF5A|nr:MULTISPECIES: hypothetical protein [unclassified Dysgonomonas]MDH6310034.1 hypothetical protein [Dysgonomonas sp. PF1-14]MDH6339943.1 hypothetical protein [Dysgonomonas sp. PF1-16]MDH6381591.1 hypothetical protein [Dysgonomonas sp. PFB1-18]MDH6398772.1 hypothetical protein [Dysgonomonas sp. PF1-23]NDV93617.1 hypothetical protein [Dysgonomonas sp. 521]
MCQNERENINVVVEVENENGIIQEQDAEPIVAIIVHYDIYWDRKGKEILRIRNEERINRTFIVLTDKETSDLYKNEDGSVAGVHGINKNVAETTERNILSLRDVEHRIAIQRLTNESANIIQIENIEVLLEMLKVAKNDNGNGGTEDAQNREYGGIIDLNGNFENTQGDPSNPENQEFAFIQFVYIPGNIKCTFHTHPSGEIKRYYYNGSELTKNEYEEQKKKINMGASFQETTRNWQQPPSRPDIQNIATTNYVFAMNNKNVYVYDNLGVRAYFKQNIISDFLKDKQKQETEVLKNRQKQEKESARNLSKNQKAEMDNRHKSDMDNLKRNHLREEQATPIPVNN